MAVRDDEIVDIVELTWFFAPSHTPSSGRRLMEVLRDDFPEALPARFGAGDPPPEKVAHGNLGPFEEYWGRRAEDEVGLDVAWSAVDKRAFGYMRFPDRRVPGRLPGRPVGVLQIQLVDSPVRRDPERLVRLFSDVAQDLTAFYGCALLLRRWALRRGVLYIDVKQSEGSPLPTGGRWLGIPPATPWLTWLGREYAALLGALVVGTSNPIGAGLIIRTAPSPGFLGPPVPWPEEVFAKWRDPRFTAVPPSEPASLLPDLG